MFKYTKLLISDIRFWCQECKLRHKEYAELERIEDEEWHHPMSNLRFYITMKHNQAERKRLYQEQRDAIK